MATRDDIVQQFLDVLDDPQVFCEGQIITYKAGGSPTLEPNCGMTNECPLFRSPQGPVIKLWRPPLSSNCEEGCMPYYQLLQQWKRSQQYWIVQFEGHGEQEVQAKDALGAACVAWWERVRGGLPIDKWLLFNKRYTVRER